MSRTLILDNGAGTIKVGWSHEDCPTHVLPNATAKVKKSMEYLVGKKIEDYLNGSQLIFSRPFDRGYLCNWKCEVDVWTSIFTEMMAVNPAQTSLVLTEPPLNPTTIQNETNEVVFEYFGFHEYSRRPAMWYSAFGATTDDSLNPNSLPVCTVVDSGFSFSHSAVFVDGRCVRPSIRRINVGGKLLTNYLKELVSYRQWNMMDEFILMNQVKEELCYVSNNVIAELKQAKYCSKSAKSAVMFDLQGTPLKKNFVLPDFHQILRGYVKPDFEPFSNTEQLLSMETERFSVPELLFHPADVGLMQPGVQHATLQTLSSVEDTLAEVAAGLVVLTGGNTRFPNFHHRFVTELRGSVPCDHKLQVLPCQHNIGEQPLRAAPFIFMQVHLPHNPDHFVWNSARKYANEVREGRRESPFLSRAAYLEYGHDYCNRFFDEKW